MCAPAISGEVTALLIRVGYWIVHSLPGTSASRAIVSALPARSHVVTLLVAARRRVEHARSLSLGWPYKPDEDDNGKQYSQVHLKILTQFTPEGAAK